MSGTREPSSGFSGFRSQSGSTQDDARQAVRRRALRERYISPAFCEGPAWNILLAIHAAGQNGLSYEEAVRSAFAPPATAQRVLEFLVSEGFLVRSASSDDNSDVGLTQDAQLRLDAYFAACHPAES